MAKTSFKNSLVNLTITLKHPFIKEIRMVVNNRTMTFFHTINFRFVMKKISLLLQLRLVSHLRKSLKLMLKTSLISIQLSSISRSLETNNTKVQVNHKLSVALVQDTPTLRDLWHSVKTKCTTILSQQRKLPIAWVTITHNSKVITLRIRSLLAKMFWWSWIWGSMITSERKKVSYHLVLLSYIQPKIRKQQPFYLHKFTRY